MDCSYCRNLNLDITMRGPHCPHACSFRSISTLFIPYINHYNSTISSLHNGDEPQQGRNSCPLSTRSCFIGSCHVGVSKRFSCSISLAFYCLYTFFWLIRSLVDPTLAAFIVCGPLQFVLLNSTMIIVSIAS